MIEIEARTVPENWFKTADALIFLAQNKETATRCRGSLLKIDPITKTLREANSWHSAATWNNLGELDDLIQKIWLIPLYAQQKFLTKQCLYYLP